MTLKRDLPARCVSFRALLVANRSTEMVRRAIVASKTDYDKKNGTPTAGNPKLSA